MTFDFATPLRRAWVAALVVLALGIGACGGSDDDGSDASAAADGGSRPGDSTYEATREGSDRAQISATLHYLRDRFNAKDGEAFCEKLAPAGVKELIRLTRIYTKKESCEDVMTQMSSKVVKLSKDGQKPVKIRSISIDGDRAVANMRGGLNGTNFAPLRLQKHDGEWKLIEISTKKEYGG